MENKHRTKNRKMTVEFEFEYQTPDESVGYSGGWMIVETKPDLPLSNRTMNEIEEVCLKWLDNNFSKYDNREKISYE
jgi:hypothetical protein